MSKRTLARKLSDEGLNYSEILEDLRRDLAVRYLDNRKLDVSKIAWLLGFHEVSAFTHAFKRWTGKTPSRCGQPALLESAKALQLADPRTAAATPLPASKPAQQ